MGKKIPAEMQAQKEKLMSGFLAHGLSIKKSQQLWAQIEPFAAYGFNKAHAASYGRVAFQTAFMKANYPLAYMTAVMTNESGDVEKIAEIVSECKRMKINVLPPDVNYSQGGFSVIKDQNGVEEIRFGLYTIKNLGEEISDAIIEEREKNGMFTSFENFIERITHKNLNKKSMEALTMCGALDALAERGEVLTNLDNILQFHKHTSKDNALQTSLFSNDQDISFTMKPGIPITQDQKLAWEKELLGLFVSGFPLDPWKDKIKERGITIEKINHGDFDNKELTLLAIIEKYKITITKKGDKMALVTLRDHFGSFEVAVFPETYKKMKDLIVADTPLLFKGKISIRNDLRTMVVDTISRIKP
jgi:DNA polymerase-3 subunit alpha